MRRIDLDFARRRALWPAAVLALAGVLVAADVGLNWAQLRERAAKLAGRSDARPAATAPSPPMSEAMRREFDTARRLLAELAKPWEALFRAIESSLDADAALLAIEPDASKQVVQISGEARNYTAILRFMNRLEKTGTLTRVHLLNHEVRDEAPERPTQFTISASWRIEP